MYGYKALFLFLMLWLSGCVSSMAYQQKQEPCESCPIDVANDPHERSERSKANAALMDMAFAADVALWSFTIEAITATIDQMLERDRPGTENKAVCAASERRVCSTANGCWCE